MKPRRFHGLKKPKFRASWNKYNLYNLTRMKYLIPHTSFNTYFQQKWGAKAITRAYHGEYIREKVWNRMFSSKLRAVVPMDPEYLAKYDGSELASGRGSGREEVPVVPPTNREERETFLKTQEKDKVVPIPYMHMTFAPIEGRLDMAIFRSLFASSARQARQMVIHGHVKVNGATMKYPGYRLNPGDMFQVDPNIVLWATGDLRQGEERLERQRLLEGQRNLRRALQEDKIASKAAKAAKGEELDTGRRKWYDDERENRAIWREKVQDLIRRGERRLAINRDTATKFNDKLDAFRREKYKLFNKHARTLLEDWNHYPWPQVWSQLKDLAAEWMVAASRLQRENKFKIEWLESKGIKPSSSEGKNLQLPPASQRFSDERKEKFLASLSNLKYPKTHEQSPLLTPYPSPWRPKQFMSVFAFVPRYLEVNFRICSAVYVRHPVARPGKSEIPSPFPYETMQLAYNWYLRRR